MTRNRLVPLIVLAAALLLGAGWWLGRHQGPAVAPQGAPAPPPSATSTGTAGGDVTPVRTDSTDAQARLPATAAPAPSTAASATPSEPVAPLPPPGTRLADVYDELFERARRGDARAACRLAADLGRCRNAPLMGGRMGRRGERAPERVAERIAGIRDEERRDQMIEMVAQAETWREQAEQICDGLRPEQLAQAFPLQVQAANAMPELRVAAALAPALDRMMPANDAEQWLQYRQLAQSWLEQAAADGDLAAIVALARVHGESARPSPPWPPYRALDDVRLVTYASLLTRYGMNIGFVNSLEEAARARLDPAALRQAEDRAQALYRADRIPDEAARAAAVPRTMPRPFEAPDCE